MTVHSRSRVGSAALASAFSETRTGRYAGWIAAGMIVLVSTAFAQPVQRAARVKPEVHHDTSIPLRQMPPAPRAQGRKLHPVLPLPRQGRTGVADPVVQSALVPLAPTTLLNFDGVGTNFTGPAGAFSFH